MNRLTLPNPRKGWRGLPLAEIELRQTEEGWIFATGVWVPGGGYGDPLGDTAYPTRREAVDAAVEKIRARCSDKGVLRWLDGLGGDLVARMAA